MSKHDTLSIAPVANQNVSKGRNPVLEWTTDGKMLHVSGRLVFQVLAQVNDSEIFLHVRTCHVSYPPWDSGREETNLNIIFALLVDSHQNAFDILFKAEFEHLVSFVKNNCPDLRKVNVASLNMVKDTTCCTDKDVNSSSELSCLIIH